LQTFGLGLLEGGNFREVRQQMPSKNCTSGRRQAAERPSNDRPDHGPLPEGCLDVEQGGQAEEQEEVREQRRRG